MPAWSKGLHGRGRRLTRAARAQADDDSADAGGRSCRCGSPGFLAEVRAQLLADVRDKLVGEVRAELRADLRAALREKARAAGEEQARVRATVL